MAAVMRLGVDEAGITELMGVTEHARGLTIAAEGLLLRSLDQSAGALVPPLEPEETGGAVQTVLTEISAWSAAAMGQPGAPLLWRILARNPHYLEATWRKDVAVMAEGALEARDKRRIALGVAMAARGPYMVQYHAAVLRHAGDSDRDLLEVLGVADYFTTLNTLAEGMQIESDIRPPKTPVSDAPGAAKLP